MKSKIILIVLLLVVLNVFYMSSFNGEQSSKKSNIISKVLIEKEITAKDLEVLFETPNFAVKKVDYLGFKKNKGLSIQTIVRKNAHLIEFFLVGSLIYFYFYSTKKENSYQILFICLFIAVIDEFWQMHIASRTSSVLDVIIDFIGAFIGFKMSMIFLKKYKKKKELLTKFFFILQLKEHVFY